MSVLIVEEDRSLRCLYERVIKTAGIHISGTAKNGMEAVEIYKTCQIKPEIILKSSFCQIVICGSHELC